MRVLYWCRVPSKRAARRGKCCLMTVTSRCKGRRKGLCVELHIQWSLRAKAFCDAECFCVPTPTGVPQSV